MVVCVDEDAGTENDCSTLFTGGNARLSQFAVPKYSGNKDFDSPPDMTLRTPETIVAEGQLRIYKILGKKAAFLQCGKFVHPILPRLRLWRIEPSVFILPQPQQGKFWRIDLEPAQGEDDIGDLESVLSAECCYRNSCDPVGEEPSEDVSPGEDSEEGENYLDGANLLSGVGEELDVVNSDEDDLKSVIVTVKGDILEIDEKDTDGVMMTVDADVLNEEDLESMMVTVQGDTMEEEEEAVVVDAEEDMEGDFVVTEPVSEVASEESKSPVYDMDFVSDLNVARPVQSGGPLSPSLDDILDTFGDAPYAQKGCPLFISGDDDITWHQVDSPQDPYDASDYSKFVAESNSSESSSCESSPSPGNISIDSQLDPSSSFLTHPLVPLSHRNNIISGLYPLRFQPMEDDWLEVNMPRGFLGSYHASLYPRMSGLGYLSWVSQVTGDIISGSSNYVNEKLDQADLARHWEQPQGSSDDDASPKLEPDFYQQVVAVSGYMGWRILSRVISPWTKK
jgi:hypothetical protein